MVRPTRTYRAIISSDWNQCLAPCGPFDFISFVYPELDAELSGVFAQYTGNRISLGDATKRIAELLPEPIGASQMDAYLQQHFATYDGVSELIEWCESSGILFMINTTGMVGYFERVWANGLLPHVPLLSANPMVSFSSVESRAGVIQHLLETQDKPQNTQKAMRRFGIRPDRAILLGDSGGDGPHFLWGQAVGAFLIGCMTKPSLRSFCREHGINIDVDFGVDRTASAPKAPDMATETDFMDLVPRIQEALAR